MTDAAHRSAGGRFPECSNIQKIRRSTRKRKTPGRLEDHDDRHKQKRRPTQSSSTRPKAPSPLPMAPIKQSRTPSVHHPCSQPQLPPKDPTAPPMAPIQSPADIGHQCLSIEQEKIRRSTRKRKTLGRLEDNNDRHKQKRRPTQRSSIRSRAPSSPPMAPIRPSRTPSVATEPPMPLTPPGSPPQLLPRDPTPASMTPVQPPADIRQEWLSKEQEYKCEDWAKCAKEKDVNTANRLLDNDILPNIEDLQLAFDNFNDDSEGKELLKDICKKIENHLMETNESIKNVKGCYKHGDPCKKIIFVIHATSERTDIHCQYYFQVKNHNKQKNAKKEIENYKFKEKFYEANECLRIKSPALMKSHSNLTGTSLSSVKSLQDPEPRTCIVLYVEAKGYVPVGEEPLPLHLEYDKDTVFKTDVRESQCAITTAGPSDKHEDLKIGCRIASSKVSKFGTLGGFIDHPDHGLCAITCAHVLLSVEEFEQIYKGNMDVKSLTTIECNQPKQPDKFGEVCDIKLFEGNQTNGGMEVAFVKVDKSRKPKTTSFPDIFADDGEMNGKIPPFIGEFLRQTLRYDPGSVLQDLNPMKDKSQVVKYGFKTKLTSGSFHCSGSSRRFKMEGEEKTIFFTLNDQIEIRDDCGKFSDLGDSGAMVFLSNENKELMALGILTGIHDEDKKTYVTPIWNILKEIKIPRPYQLAEVRSTRKIIEELKRSALSISKKCDDLTRVLKH